MQVKMELDGLDEAISATGIGYMHDWVWGAWAENPNIIGPLYVRVLIHKCGLLVRVPIAMAKDFLERQG